MKSISASEFKAKCLAILDEIAAGGEVVTILKHGRPVAQLVPPTPRATGFAQEHLLGTVEIIGDVIAPAADPEHWETGVASRAPILEQAPRRVAKRRPSRKRHRS